MNTATEQKPQPLIPRQGSVLLVVLVLIAMLSLAAYTFTEIMLSESQATNAFARDVQARAMADSGVETAAAFLGDRTEAAEANFYNNPPLFQGVLLQGTESDVPRARGRFSLVAPVENDTTFSRLRFGLVNESAKLNLNTLVNTDGDLLGVSLGGDRSSSAGEQEDSGDAAALSAEEQARGRLLFLPGMTEYLADAILDFIDSDDEPREFGAESDYYVGLNPSYEAKNAPLESLDELLLVRDVTPALLFGIDVNRNGLIDPAEEAQYADVMAGLGIDDSPFGWSTWLTVYSRESNFRADGTPRINLNGDNLQELHDQLAEEYDEDTARFVIAYRISGPVSAQEEEDENDSGNQPSGGGGGGQSSGDDDNDSGDEREEELVGGIDISGGAEHTVTSIYDLIDAEVEVDGEQTTLTSPWSSEPNDLLNTLPGLVDTLTATEDEFLEGRVNVAQAREEVLLGIPGITEELVDKILDSQPVGADLVPSADTTSLHATAGWILIEGLTDLETMRALAPHVTGGGDVYRLQAVGYYDEGGPMARMEAVIDAARYPPKVVFQRDLSDLGRGFSPSQLNPIE